MFHEYPYTDFHELNLDYLMKLARESLGLHLDIQGKDLALVNAAGQNVSKVRVAFATTAEKDEEGNDIVAYVFDAGLEGRALVFTKGDGTSESIVIPFATTAEKDINNKDITSYVSRVGVSGNKILVTFGDGTTYSFTCPYANKAGQAETDENGKNLTTYMADVEVSGNNIVFKDGEGVTLKTITVSYAENAGVAEKAAKDPNGNAFLSNYAYQLSIDGNKIGIDSHDGTTINKITVPFSTLSTDATNAIETVTINGNDIIFSTYGGQQFTITCPFAVKAQKDDLGNNIKNTYVANVTTNPNTGAITFLDAQGNTIVTITPTVDAATHDALGNTISDYVKAIAVSASSNYVTVTHGDGDVDTLTINYSTHAFKDLNNQSIHNTYCTLLACEEDVEDGHYKLVGYNGDVPVAEIFRITLIADAAKHDHLGNVISEYYAHSMSYNNNVLQLINAEGDTLSSVTIDVDEAENIYVIQAADPVANTIEDVSASTAGVAFVAKLSSLNVDIKNSITPAQVLDEIISNGARAIFLICLGDPTAQPFTPGAINLSAQSDLYVNGQLTFRDITDKAHLGELVEVFATFSNNAWTLNNLSVVDVEAGATELSDLDDVNISSPSDGQVLKYDGTSHKWVNGSAGGGGGSSLVVTLTSAVPGTPIDLTTMSARSSVSLNANKTYAEMKAADEIIFKITETTQTGSKYTLKPTGMRTFNVAADQSLIYTFSVITPSNNTPKVFKLDISPWGNYFTFECVA